MKSKTKKEEKVIGICRLCNDNTKQELKNSHIIPKFVFRHIKKHNPEYVLCSINPKIPAELGQEEFQEYLLCYECEQKIGKAEKYASDLLFYPKRRRGLKVKVRETSKEKKFIGIDYNTFKLFQLSILWRTSVATRSELFSKIGLAPERNEELRQMLYTEQSCQPDKYGCEMIEIYDDEKLIPVGRADTIDGLLIAPFWRPIDPTVSMDTLKYIFIFAGYVWQFYVPSHNMLPEIKKSFLTKEGNLSISKQCMWDIPWLKEGLGLGVHGGEKSRRIPIRKTY
jgi:hypothetical protein